MSDANPLLTPSANLKKAICWLGETARDHPGRARSQLIQEAELRFDLTPLEASFLEKNFTEVLASHCA